MFNPEVAWHELPRGSRTWLVSDNGSSYLSHAFEDYLRMLHIRHIRCAPHHPQTKGKSARFHETLEARLNLLVYASPEQLRAAMAEFIDFTTRDNITRESQT